MTETAGAVADGLIIHPFTTERYLRQADAPHLHSGLQSAGRRRPPVERRPAPFIVTGRDDKEFARARRLTADRIAFYADIDARLSGSARKHGWR